MTGLTNALLRQAHAAAVKHAKLNGEITAAFEERYGCTYSDIDADPLIDSLDYGNGETVTLAECDRIMSIGGRPPVSLQQQVSE